jgi:hypothetical protein
MKNRNLLIGLAIFAGLVCSVCLCLTVIGSIGIYKVSQNPEVQVLYREITATSTPTPEPKVSRDPLPLPLDYPSTETLLLETDVPVRDLRLLASRLKYNGQELPVVVNPTPPTYTLGDQETFWISDDSGPTPRQFQATATLEHITEHTYWWIEDGFTVDLDDLRRSAETFETQTYPTNRDFFGSEWTPGVDNDVRLSIYLGNIPGVGGYYASLNEFSAEVNPYSNEREMFFINLNVLTPGSEFFDGVLAHEFQHMIHWWQDRNEATWVNEGLSELASHLNGYNVDNAYQLYLRQPDLQLTAWGHSSSQSLPYYGSSYLFMLYFLEQFGEEMVKQVVAHPENSLTGFNQVLQNAGYAQTFDDVFADFIIANYLNDPMLAAGRWGYRDLSFRHANTAAVHNTFPGQYETTVHQYGADYIEIESNSPFTIHFTGSTVINVVDNEAHSGRYQWYSNRGDDSNTTLTRAFDLRDVSAATLNYWAWFDIEEDWDYAYLEVSTNGGQSWTIIKTSGSRDTNPSGNAYGPGYTGSSAGWIQETADLSPYTGQEILLRFEYITDDAVNSSGFTLDDVSIPEIDFFDDMETPDPAWIADGFIRMDNLLKQRFIVQLIELGENPTVARFVLDETNVGRLTIDRADGGRFILVVSAQAPVTTEVTSYAYSLVQND